MDEIEMIETEWGSELHRELTALKTRQRIEWRNSPEASEEAKRMREAGPLEWGRVILPRPYAEREPDDDVPGSGWKILSPGENEAAAARLLKQLQEERVEIGQKLPEVIF